MSENFRDFTETSHTVARAAGVCAKTVRLYADLGFLDHMRTRGGHCRFKPSVIAQVRVIHAERMTHTGHRMWRARPAPNAHPDFEPEADARVIDEIKAEHRE
jgi:hypothetical protein